MIQNKKLYVDKRILRNVKSNNKVDINLQQLDQIVQKFIDLEDEKNSPEFLENVHKYIKFILENEYYEINSQIIEHIINFIENNDVDFSDKDICLMYIYKIIKHHPQMKNIIINKDENVQRILSFCCKFNTRFLCVKILKQITKLNKTYLNDIVSYFGNVNNLIDDIKRVISTVVHAPSGFVLLSMFIHYFDERNTVNQKNYELFEFISRNCIFFGVNQKYAFKALNEYISSSNFSRNRCERLLDDDQTTVILTNLQQSPNAIESALKFVTLITYHLKNIDDVYTHFNLKIILKWILDIESSIWRDYEGDISLYIQIVSSILFNFVNDVPETSEKMTNIFKKDGIIDLCFKLYQKTKATIWFEVLHFLISCFLSGNDSIKLYLTRMKLHIYVIELLRCENLVFRDVLSVYFERLYSLLNCLVQNNNVDLFHHIIDDNFQDTILSELDDSEDIHVLEDFYNKINTVSASIKDM